MHETIILIFFYLGLIILYTFLFLLARSLSNLLHELGRSLPALILSKEKVFIYIGEYDSNNNYKKIILGKLEIQINTNLNFWIRSISFLPNSSLSIKEEIICTIAGLITPISTGIIALYFTYQFKFDGYFKFFLFFLIIASLFDLYQNLKKDNNPKILTGGRKNYNDAYQLKLLFKKLKFTRLFKLAEENFNNKKFEDALILVEKMISIGILIEAIYRLSGYTYYETQQYEKANIIFERFSKKFNLNSEDYNYWSRSVSELGFNDRAFDLIEESLKLDPNNLHSLYSMANILLKLERFEEAIGFYNETIDLGLTASYTFRGISKIKLGDYEGGFSDINYFLKLYPENIVGIKNLGIFHFEKKEYRKALDLFLKAKKLSPNSNLLDEYIKVTEQKISDSE